MAFFEKFKQLAAKVDNLVEQYKTAVYTKNKENFCPKEVKVVISDMRNDLKKMESAVDKELADINESVTKLDNMISAGNGFLDNLLQKHEVTEQYLKQYGYKTYDEVHGRNGNDEDNIVIEEEAEGGAAAAPVDLNRTPQPEDFGISEMTLKMMKSVQKDKFSKQKPQVPSVPSIFQHNGIICSPDFSRSLDPNASYFPDLHAALASPVSEVKKSLFGASASALGNDDLEPVEPELTYSLEALTEMTGMYKFNPLPKPRPATTNRSNIPVNKSVTSSAKPYSKYAQHSLNDDKENATPPEPRLMSEQSSRITEYDLSKYCCDDMPASPKLLGNYDFMK